MSAFGEQDDMIRGSVQAVLGQMPAAWVILVDANKPQEGVYTLSGSSGSDEVTDVLAFEQQDEAGRFANMLSGQAAMDTTPACWRTGDLDRFCRRGGYTVRYVPEGALLTPPEQNYGIDGAHKQQELMIARQKLEGLLNVVASDCPPEEGCEV
jgi:hypothetical protein